MFVLAVVYFAGCCLVVLAAVGCAAIVCYAALRGGNSEGMLPAIIGGILFKGVLIAPFWPLGVFALAMAAAKDYSNRRRGLISDF